MIGLQNHIINVEYSLLSAMKPICDRYNIDADRKRFAWKNIFGADKKAIQGNPRTTLVTQFTPDRFNRLSMVAKNWDGL